MGIGAAIGASALAGVAGSVISSKSAKSAADTQANAADNAAQLQANATLQAQQIQQQEQAQTREDLLPYNLGGQNDFSVLNAIFGSQPSGGNYQGPAGSTILQANGLSGLTFQPTQAQLAATPGYQFDLAQGQQGVANSNAAQGRGISGAALKGAANYATGLANNTLTTQQGIFQQNLGNILNPLEYGSSLGENAAAQTGSLGQASAANQGSLLQSSAANQGNLLTSGAAATGAGQVGSANALTGGLNSLGNSGLSYLLLSGGLGGGNNLSSQLAGDPGYTGVF